ncbi:glucose dehydrogenase short protein [Mycena rebaudengoi]|nr:glucose dehydrogenase short protein [Mycena rebaudengoi]
MLTHIYIFLACFSVTAWAKVYEHVIDLPGLDYDFVIVGGGTAGNVLANRLTENPKFSVLVLEAGVSNEGVTAVDVPFFEDQLSPYGWNYTTTPQAGLNGRTVPYSRARILGGCSAHNGMVYTRGTADDFDRYAKLTGDAGWSWKQIFPYFLKNEKWSPPADHHNTAGQFDPTLHSTKGLVSVSLNGFAWSTFEQKVIQTTKELPDDFPFNLDMNSGKPLGLGWLQSTIGDGTRSSSATSYLAAKYVQRQNLHVLLEAQVSRLVNVSKAKGKITFGGVQFRQGGSLFTAKASKEIILAAGAVGSPQILIHSGIGNRKTLAAAGVPTVLDLPSVGQNASDHSLFATSWSVNSTETIDPFHRNSMRVDEAFAEWNQTHTGPLVEPGVTHIAWLRLEDDAPIFADYPDPSAGPDTPHIELFFLPTGLTGGAGNFMSIFMAMVTPAGRGSITINSNNPFDSPLVNPGVLASDFDLFTLRDAWKRVQKFVSAPAWKNYIIAPTEDLENITSEALDQHIRNSVLAGLHMVGSAGMSAQNAGYGVVDPDFLVKGVSGLRIIDASVIPIVPAAHTQAAVYAFAERGSDLIKQSWR